MHGVSLKCTYIMKIQEYKILFPQVQFVIHVFLPAGRKINYGMTFAENGICEGMILHAVITG